VIDADVQSANIGIHSAWMNVNDRVLWRRIIDTALQGHATEEEERRRSLARSEGPKQG